MFYLSDDIYIEYDFSSKVPVGSRLEFQVGIAPIPFDLSAYRTVYNGIITVFNKKQRIYLNDILATNMYQHDYITPDVQLSTSGEVTQQTKSMGDIAESIVSVKVSFPSINLNLYLEPIAQYYKDVNVPRVEWTNWDDAGSNDLYNLLDLRPVNVLPHIPSLTKETNNFWVGILFARSNGFLENGDDEIVVGTDRGEVYYYLPRAGVTSLNVSGELLYQVCGKNNVAVPDTTMWLSSWSDSESKTINVATVDLCPSRYYLIWMDRTGAYQCQRFNKKVTHSENITNTNIINYLDEMRPVVKSVKDTWVVNSDWLSEREYKCYESIFVSPYVYLYDTETDEGYWVNIANKSWTEKTNKNDKKPYNLSLTLESNRDQKIIY
jgi:hypothetical protein